MASSPFQLATSALFVQIPRSPRTVISAVSATLIGLSALRTAASISLKTAGTQPALIRAD